MTVAESEIEVCARLAAPGVSSVLFAPSSHNYSLSAVTSGISLVDAIVLECFSGLEQQPTAHAWQVGRRLADFYEGCPNISDTSYLGLIPTSSVTMTLLGGTALITQPVPLRQFPFVTHSNLLASPVEGTFFDPDDFVER